MIYSKLILLFSFTMFFVMVYGVSLWALRNGEKMWYIFQGLLSNVFGGFLTFLVLAIIIFHQGGGFGLPIVVLGSILISLANQLIATYYFRKSGNFYAILGVWLIYPLSYVGLYSQFTYEDWQLDNAKDKTVWSRDINAPLVHVKGIIFTSQYGEGRHDIVGRMVRYKLGFIGFERSPSYRNKVSRAERKYYRIYQKVDISQCQAMTNGSKKEWSKRRLHKALKKEWEKGNTKLCIVEKLMHSAPQEYIRVGYFNYRSNASYTAYSPHRGKMVRVYEYLNGESKYKYKEGRFLAEWTYTRYPFGLGFGERFDLDDFITALVKQPVVTR